MEIAVLALGCFWGPEIRFSKINGIIKQKLDTVEEIALLQPTKFVLENKSCRVVKLDLMKKLYPMKDYKINS